MKKVQWLSLLSLAVILVLIFTACASDLEIATDEDSGTTNRDVLTLKLGHQTPESTNYHEMSLKFQELVAEKSEGKVEIDIYPARQLGADRELLEAMQFGNLDFGVISSPPISGFTPDFMVLDLPFFFEDWHHVERFLDSDVHDELLATTDSAGLKTFSLMARGYRHVTTSDRPIEKPEDLKGLDLRVIETPVYVQSYEALGANAQAMSWPDAYTALEQGAMDGQENTMDIIYDERVYDVNQYVSKTGVSFTFAALMASKDNFEALPGDVQSIIVEAAQEAADYINPVNREKEESYEKLLEEEGMTINEVDRKPFKEHVQHIYNDFTKEHGNTFYDGINALK